ncbi:aldehyde dehydrogenase EutE [Roseospira marina]|uniref:Aldehyde dehydrogenase EutE n=1 Tax=Roseospira marina TaxID=140057 RepID=A0A5M6IFJ1_9PROT|nr:aldehyde dehydrogenase family protein [Roseospira marina]KAA5607066.1 aldehyde dehydrogenase EutE [Roseospira marina]MBB4312743.1 propionaldehyde dehydrogenase [Roseospira marina]MBB5086484.1 propionaldehyde dehydrogenase [Roseospira marina]
MDDGQITAIVDEVLGAYGGPKAPPAAPTPTTSSAPASGADADAIARAVADILKAHRAETPAPAAETVRASVPGTKGCCWKMVDDTAGDPVERILAKVMSEPDGIKPAAAPTGAGDGIFETMDAAVAAAVQAQRQYLLCTMADRQRFVDGIRAVVLEGDTAETLSRMTVEETGMGRLEHKIIKNRLAASKTPGTEDLTTQAMSGDDGLSLVEYSPYGVIGAVCPTTNPTETIICNAIGMLAAGNAVVFSPHPRAKGVSLLMVRMINEKLAALGAPANLVVTVATPSIDNTNAMMSHPDIKMLVATGGPGIVKAVMSTGKKAIGAGAGNPPVVVDETADIEKAARDIVNGCSFDNNLPCTAEKELIAVDQIADFLIHCMKGCGAYHVTDPAVVQKLEALVLTEKGTPNTGFVGKNAQYILEKAGVSVTDDVRVILIELPKEHPFVQEELLMPILPLVRVPDVDQAILLAIEVEHGNRHTAIMHSTNVRKLTKMGKLIQTTIFVKNGPSYAGLGAGGMGHGTFTIAGPTGEGLTSAKSFARLRRCVMVEALNIR